MTLEVLICTCGSAVARAVDVVLPPMAGVRWLVSWQTNEDAPKVPAALMGRDDVRVVTQSGRGLARNRNNALRHATGDVCVLADDDNIYNKEELMAVARLFEQHPQLDMALLKSLDYDGTEMKAYPAEPFAYGQRPRGYYAQSSDVAFRRASIRFGFDERFGIGTALPGGEDELFVHEAWRRGLTVEYHPLVLCRTAPITTGSRMDSDPSLLRAKGAVLAIMHGRLSASLRVLKYALTHHVLLPALLQGVWRS